MAIKTLHRHCPGHHYQRRDFLRVGALSFLGVG